MTGARSVPSQSGSQNTRRPERTAPAGRSCGNAAGSALDVDLGVDWRQDPSVRLAARTCPVHRRRGRRQGRRGLRHTFTARDDYDAVLEAARKVTIPIEFLLPWDDAEIDRESGLELFDAFASEEKTLHTFPGSHFRVPEERIDTRFFARQLGGAADVPALPSRER